MEGFSTNESLESQLVTFDPEILRIAKSLLLRYSGADFERMFELLERGVGEAGIELDQHQRDNLREIFTQSGAEIGWPEF